MLTAAFASPTRRRRPSPRPNPGCPTSARRETAPLNIAFISYANPQQVARDSEGVKYLQKFLGVPVGFVTLDYGSAIEAMRGGRADAVR